MEQGRLSDPDSEISPFMGGSLWVSAESTIFSV